MDDELKVTPAANLPDGWEWRIYDDGSGGLYSPDNKRVVEVDFATSEYRREGKWHFMSGYPHETVSRGEFMDGMEKIVRANLEREGKLPELFSDLGHPTEQSLSPAQMALNEPGIFDEDIDCIDTSTCMSMLTDRLNANFIDYIDKLRGMSDGDITNYTSEIARVSEAHYFLTERFNFHFSELDYLLNFKDPLMVVVEAFSADIDKEHSVVMWKVFHEQEALKSGEYALYNDASAEPVAPTAEVYKQKLFERLDKNLLEYRDSMMANSKQYVYDMADEIATRYAACEYMKTAYDYKTGEVEFLLQFQDPLSFVADRWPSTLDGIANLNDEISGILADRSSHGHYALVMGADNPAASEKGRSVDSAEKQSVLERIRAAERAPKEPRKDKGKSTRSNSELEH